MEKEIEAALHRIGLGLESVASALGHRETGRHSFWDEAALRVMQSLISHESGLINSPESLALLVFDLADAMEHERLKRDSLTLASVA